jgi:PAS domain-containing protein
MKKKISAVFGGVLFRIILYVLFVIFSIAGIIATDQYLHKKMLDVNNLTANEASKMRLNDILKHELDHVHLLLLGYLSLDGFSQMDSQEKMMRQSLAHAADVLSVLGDGGVFAPADLSYSKQKGEVASPLLIKMKTSFTDIYDMVEDFRNAKTDMLIAEKNGSEPDTERAAVAVSRLNDLFVRVNKLSADLYEEMAFSQKSTKEESAQLLNRLNILKLRADMVFAVLLTVSGLLVIISTYKAVSSGRQNAASQSNQIETLRETVRKLKDELHLEVHIREQKERESEAKAKFLTDVIESLAHPFYVIDADTYEIILANNAAYEVIGSRGATCYELTHHSNHPCDGIDHPCPLKSVKDTGCPTVVEHVHTVKGGENRYYEVHGYPVRNGEGQIVQMIEYSLDITDKKDTEFALINFNTHLEEKIAEVAMKLQEETKLRQKAEERLKKYEK